MDTYRHGNENSQSKKISNADAIFVASLVALLLISLGLPSWGAPN